MRISFDNLSVGGFKLLRSDPNPPSNLSIPDSYPDDPSRGYIVGDDDEEDGFLPGFGLPVMVASFLVAVPAVWWGRKVES